jgi:DNA-directed RNA polymerase specialized sigma24 family protein
MNLELLVEQAADGDELAWQSLWGLLDSQLDRLVRRHRLLGRLSDREDDRRGVVVLVMDKLRQDGFRRLKLFRDERRRNPDLAPMAWLAVVTRHAAIDYLRAHPDYVAAAPRDGSRRPGNVVEPVDLPSESRLGLRPPMTMKGTAGEVINYARRELSPQQRGALELWLAGHSAADIAVTIGTASVDEAERIVRAAIERLRRRFRSSVTGPA